MSPERILAGYIDHLDALADGAVAPEDLEAIAGTHNGSLELHVPESAARHKPGELPLPDQAFLREISAR